MQAQIGAWVEGTVAKRDGKGLRKVWVTGSKAEGESMRLSVIAGEGDRTRHVLTLAVNTPEERQAALEALTLAAQALIALGDPAPVPAPAPKAPKAPTPPAKSAPAPLVASPDKRPVTGRVINPAPSAPVAADGTDWFASIMAQA